MNYSSCAFLDDYNDYRYSLTNILDGNGNPLSSMTNLSQILLNCKTGKLFAYWITSYPPIPSWVHFIIGCFMIFIMITGVSGNFIAFWIFSSTKSLRTPSNLLLLNLVFNDSMILLSNCPLSIIALFKENWFLGDLGCNFYGFTGSLFGLLSINTIASIACDRAFVIGNSIKGKKINYKQAIFIIILIWSYCLFWCFLPLGAWGAYVFEGPLTSCTIDYISRDKSTISYALCLFIFCFVVPLLVIMISYIIIFRTIVINNKQMKQQSKEISASRRLMHMRGIALDIKIAKMALYLLFGFLVAWGPYASLFVISLIGKTPIITPIVTLFPAMFAKTSALYNPFIYALSYQKYKKALLRKFGYTWCGNYLANNNLLGFHQFSLSESGRSTSRRNAIISDKRSDKIILMLKK
ncbi:rhodopsin-like [Gordionus sp. m RMFG-2023]|uniref:rhodopsin-like n=1 Tax=Gordionus sp. m RMFG-2023 TaxID=3053472 RepID=UPI0031FCC478